ncbi:MAG: winged helix-turn-helix domain-containing protein [Thomasclavelia ramosa]
MCINYGADDFVTKPYNPLICLQIEAVLKRANPKKINNYQDICLDVSKSSIIKNNQVVDLSKNELKIFYYLLSHRGIIISREKLMSYLWDSDMFVDDNTLTVNINRLRKKLEDVGLKDVILTKRKQGYIIL